MTHQDAERCLICRNARCQTACPIHTPIPQIIEMYRSGNRMEEAGKLLFENNPLSAVTSQVCNWQSTCFGHCILNAKKQPIHFYEIEQEISCSYLQSVIPDRKPDNGISAAVIGGGPAGITAAILLAEKGYRVTLYEKQKQLGGVLRYGIPEFRLDKKYIDRYESILLDMHVSIHTNSVCGKDYTPESLLKDGNTAVFIALGAESPSSLRIPGEDRQSVIYAIDYLKKPDAYPLGHKVIVIGGGNVAMDACRTAVRKGADTWVYYRKTFANMPANQHEVEEAKAEGVQFAVFEAPVEVKAHSVIFRQCENITDENGKVKTRIIPDTDHEVECDTLIVAVSERTDRKLLESLGLKLNDWGCIDTDEDGRTSLTGVYASGDSVYGPSTVIQAAAGAKKAAAAMDAYCMKERKGNSE